MWAKLFMASTAFAQWQPAPPILNPVPTPYPGMDVMQIELNEVRAQNDLPLLVSTIELACAANRHAEDLNKSNSCGHEGSDGSTFAERAKACGTEASAELVACGFELPETVMARWMRDFRSNRIILNSKNLAIGTAHVGNKWVIVFRTESK